LPPDAGGVREPGRSCWTGPYRTAPAPGCHPPSGPEAHPARTSGISAGLAPGREPGPFLPSDRVERILRAAPRNTDRRGLPRSGRRHDRAGERRRFLPARQPSQGPAVADRRDRFLGCRFLRPGGETGRDAGSVPRWANSAWGCKIWGRRL
jgi:hypothetical protein